MLLKLTNAALRRLGYRIVKDQEVLPADLTRDAAFMKLYRQVRPYTMTSIERLYALYQALQYTEQNRIAGDIVECGVWKGGSSMFIAAFLKDAGNINRTLYLYDTFEGMSEPTEQDRIPGGPSAAELLQSESKDDPNSVWCYSSLDEVRKNLASTGYPLEKMKFIKGKVEDTLPVEKPQQIALLRLDTDWYESTKVELELLYPLLSTSGLVIIDDFGHWEGARKAVQEYFASRSINPMLHRIDETGRCLVKQA